MAPSTTWSSTAPACGRWAAAPPCDHEGGAARPDDLRAGYVVVHGDRHGHLIEHRRVAYDHDACVRRVRASGHPSQDYIASFQLGQHVLYPAHRPGAFAPTP